MWQPDYDFELFELPFSALEANEFGAATRFQASDPTAFVDYSLNQLYGLLDPRAVYPYVQRQFPATLQDIPFVSFFQSQQGETPEAIRERLRKVRDDADRMLQEAGGGGRIVDPLDPYGTGKRIGKVITESPITNPVEGGRRIGETAKEWLKYLPAGSGMFLVAIGAIILLILFVRSR